MRDPTTWADVGFMAVWFVGLAIVLVAYGFAVRKR